MFFLVVIRDAGSLIYAATARDGSCFVQERVGQRSFAGRAVADERYVANVPHRMDRHIRSPGVESNRCLQQLSSGRRPIARGRHYAVSETSGPRQLRITVLAISIKAAPAPASMSSRVSLKKSCCVCGAIHRQVNMVSKLPAANPGPNGSALSLKTT